jgi:hypothetical protein
MADKIPESREVRDWGKMRLHAIWTDDKVMESMHAIRAAIDEWERVGAAEEVDSDDMAEVESRFVEAWSEFEFSCKEYHKRMRKTR